MQGEFKTANIVNELPPIPVPPPDGPHFLPPTPPPCDTLSPLSGDPMMSALHSPGLSLSPGLFTPRSYTSFSPPAVLTPGAHDLDFLNELREVSNSPNPIHEVLRDPAILSTLLSHRKKPRRTSSSSHTPTTARGIDVPSGRDRSGSDAHRTRESSKTRTSSRSRDRDRDRESSAHPSDTTSTASTVKPRKKERERDSESAAILTQVLAEEERQARHLKAVLRQTGARLEEELRRADVAETRARTAEMSVQDLGTRLGSAEAGRHQAELDATRAQEECRRWQMQADAGEREARRLQTELGRAERMRAEAEDAQKEARDAARRAEQVLREWQAREQGREEVRRLEVRRRFGDGREEGFEDGRAEGYEAGHQDGYEAGRDEGYENGRVDGFNAGRLTGFEEGKKTAYAGVEEGKKAAYGEGYEAGYAHGRKDERVHALEAFDRFVESEVDHRSVTELEGDDRTRRWVDATRKMRERAPPSPPRQQPQPPPAYYQPQPQAQPSPPQAQSQPLQQPLPHPAQSPSHRGMPAEPAPPIYVQPPPGEYIQAPQPVQAVREPSPAPKLVWLHRPLNHHRESPDPGRPLPVVPEQRA